MIDDNLRYFGFGFQGARDLRVNRYLDFSVVVGIAVREGLGCISSVFGFQGFCSRFFRKIVNLQ